MPKKTAGGTRKLRKMDKVVKAASEKVPEDPQTQAACKRRLHCKQFISSISRQQDQQEAGTKEGYFTGKGGE